jgi:hypothetical protein
LSELHSLKCRVSEHNSGKLFPFKSFVIRRLKLRQSFLSWECWKDMEISLNLKQKLYSPQYFVFCLKKIPATYVFKLLIYVKMFVLVISYHFWVISSFKKMLTFRSTSIDDKLPNVVILMLKQNKVCLIEYHSFKNEKSYTNSPLLANGIDGLQKKSN